VFNERPFPKQVSGDSIKVSQKLQKRINVFTILDVTPLVTTDQYFKSSHCYDWKFLFIAPTIAECEQQD